jgi:hypothetical protein
MVEGGELREHAVDGRTVLCVHVHVAFLSCRREVRFRYGWRGIERDTAARGLGFNLGGPCARTSRFGSDYRRSKDDTLLASESERPRYIFAPSPFFCDR